MKRQVKLLLHRDSHLHHLYLGVRIILAEAQVSILPPPPSLYLYLAHFLPAGREFRERELTKNCEGLSLKTRNHTLNRESIQHFMRAPRGRDDTDTPLFKELILTGTLNKGMK